MKAPGRRPCYLDEYTVVLYLDRLTQAICEERPAAPALQFLYGEGVLSRLLGRPCCHLLTRSASFSRCMGWWFRRPQSARLIAPFIQAHGMDAEEFLEPLSSFKSFNDFFIRRLKSEARPLAAGDTTALIPADGRYRFFENIQRTTQWNIKGKSLDLAHLLGDAALAERYVGGSMVVARLAPCDYHRFHFPCDCLAEAPRLINGYRYSVHPLALKYNLQILSSNKRFLTPLVSEAFGTILYIEVGAFAVADTVQTYIPGQLVHKGDEKGFFQFGASCIILLFEPGRIAFDSDLLACRDMEIRCLFGQSMGTASISY